MLRKLLIILALVSVSWDRTFASEIIKLPFGLHEGPRISTNGEAVVSVRYGNIWTESSGLMRTGLSSGWSVSADGSVVAGNVDDVDSDGNRQKYPAVWREGTGLERLLLPGYEWGETTLESTSDDGTVVGYNERCDGGICGYVGFYWTAEDGTQVLDPPLPHDVKRRGLPRKISGDGSTIVSWLAVEREELGQPVVEYEWLIWNRETGQNTQIDFEDTGFRPLFAISRSGNAIVGRINLSDDPSETVAARWTESTGVENLGILPGGATSESTDVSADGEVVVGNSANAAFVWDEHFGMRELRQVLVDEYEMSLSTDIDLERGNGISGDRKSLVTEYSSGFGGGSHLIKLDWPIGPPTDDGDMNFDDVVDANDIDLQMEAIRQYPKATFHDLDFSGQVNGDDLTYLIKTTLNTWIGDANLDGQFNSGDMVGVFLAGEYEDGVDGNSGWAEGDWNADGDFTSRDLTVAFLDGGYELGLRPAAIAVPEPSIWTQVVAIFIASAGLRVSRRKPRS